MLGLNKLLTPHCRGSLHDNNGETRVNILLIDAMHNIDNILNDGRVKVVKK